MPREMFNDVVDPQVKVGGQKWYTVPLSIVVHTAVIAAIIIIPLLAAEVLPEVPSMMAFVAATGDAEEGAGPASGPDSGANRRPARASGST